MPPPADACLHLIHDADGLLAIEQKPLRLREQIRGVCIAAVVTDRKGQIATLDTYVARRDQVIGGREAEVLVRGIALDYYAIKRSML